MNLILTIMMQPLTLTDKKTTAKKGLSSVRASPFAIVGRNCKVQRYFFGSTLVQN